MKADCSNCPFRVKNFCAHPKNLDIKRRQFHRRKLLTPRFYPERPRWCKLG